MIVSLDQVNPNIKDGNLTAIPNLDVPAAIDPGPHAQHVLAAADAENGATDLVAGLSKLVTDQRQQQVFPVAVRNALAQPNNPLSTALVGFILPDRTNVLFEYVVVRHGRQLRRPFHV